MKKYKFLLLFMLPISLFAISSCSDDDDDQEYVSLVTVAENDGARLFMLSDSMYMHPENFTITSAVGQRMLVQYEIKETKPSNTPYKYRIKLEDYRYVLTKDVIDLTAANQAEIGNDPYWRIRNMNSGGGFLNVYLSFLYNGTPHFVNLVYNTITPPQASADTIRLELRQNANGGNAGFIADELVSFNVSNYLTAAQEEGKTKLVMAVKVLLPNNVESLYFVDFKIGKPNLSPEYFDLGVYNPTQGATK